MHNGLVQPLAPCFVTHNLALGGAQTAVLRLINALPPWVRDRTTLYSQSPEMPLLEAAVKKHSFSVGHVTTLPPTDPSCWVISYGNMTGLAARPNSLLLHSWDDAGWRYITKAYEQMRGASVAAVSRQVLDRYRPWIAQQGHSIAGILPPPVTEWCIVKGRPVRGRLTVGWMGRPLESKGLLSLPYLLKLEPRMVIRAWTGADTGGSAQTRREQARTLDALMKLAVKLGVADRLDLRSLDFDPFAYRHRLAGIDVLLGNSKQEGFLLTAAEALSCGIPVVVTRTCGVADLIRDGVNGCLIDWDENPKRLARDALDALKRASHFDSVACLRSAQELSLSAGYRHAHANTLAQLTHTSLQSPAPRITVGVRIHHQMSITSLDQAISSLAMQTYRNFRTILLVDGPWEWGQMLAARYDLPLLCTGMPADITHCSALHRQAVAECDTEFYKPLDYDDQLLPEYLKRAVETLDRTNADVYGCLLWTLENGEISERRWPHKPLGSMFTGNPDDNMLPHSSVLMRTKIVRAAGNYQERAVGLGADDYNLWYRIHKAGGTFIRDDESRNVIYRIHESNSLRIRRKRYGTTPGNVRRDLIAGATAASMALWMAPRLSTSRAMVLPPDAGVIIDDQAQMPEQSPHKTPVPQKPTAAAPHVPLEAVLPPHS
jgi:glycosyltransferase involved in cell wall biosynthesis